MFTRHQPLRTFSGCVLLSLFLLLSLTTPFAKAQSNPGTTRTATPVISPASGQYGSAQTITITDSTPGATIYYQLWKSNALLPQGGPNPAFVPYSGPFTVSNERGGSVDAYATAPGYTQSDYVQNTYDLALPVPAPPTISLAGGAYSGPQVITLSDRTPNTTLYYTLDGTDVFANPNRLVYTGPITITADTVLSVLATGDSLGVSDVISSQYIIAGANAPFIYTLAGNGQNGYAGDGASALLATLNFPTAVVRDGAGNLYLLDAFNYVVRKVAAGTGIISTYAGTGTTGYSGDGGPATQATLGFSWTIAADAAGNLYIADSDHGVVREVAAGTGTITTVAGTGSNVFNTTGDGGPATAATLYQPSALALDSSGNLFIGDNSYTVRKITASTGIISTVAGNGSPGDLGDNGPATQASIYATSGLAVDSSGNLFIASNNPGLVRRVDAKTGIITTVAGLDWNVQPTPGNGQAATNTVLSHPNGIAVDAQGNLYIAESGANRIRKVDAHTGVLTSATSGVEGTCNTYGGDAGAAANAGLCNAYGISVDDGSNLLIADSAHDRIRVISPAAVQPDTPTAAPTFSLSAGTYNAPQVLTITDSAPGAALYVTLDGSTPSTLSNGYRGPISITGDVTIKAVAAAPGFLTSASTEADYVITSPPPRVISTVGGSSNRGITTSGVPATSAFLNNVTALTTDPAGNIFFILSPLNSVGKITPDGTFTILAGNDTYGMSGDGGPAAQATLQSPQALATDRSGNLFIADGGGAVIRRIAADTGVITTIAGNIFASGPASSGDGGPAAAAHLGNATGLAVDAAGNLFTAEQTGCRVRRIDAATGIINTIVGTGTCTHSGDNGPASAAGLQNPMKIAVAANGDLYLLEDQGSYLRKVTAATGTITTVAGAGKLSGASGDGGPAINAQIDAVDLAVDPNNDVYFSDISANTIRKVDATTGIISAIAGNGYFGFSGDGGAATMASLSGPSGLAFDGAGDLFVADSANSRIRKVSAPPPADAPTFSLAAGTYTGSQTITISETTPGAVIHYTTDGSAPTVNSPTYTGPVTITSTTSLAAVAMAPGHGTSAVSTAKYTIVVPVTPTLTLSPSNATIAATQSLALVVTVSGQAGAAVPTGTVVLTAGSGSMKASLVAGVATFQLAGADLEPGANPVSVSYSGDAVYGSTSSNTVVNVAQITATAGQPTAAPAGTPATAKVNLVAGTGYNGTLALSCSLTSSPAAAQQLPTCTVAPGTVTLTSGATVSVTATVTTTAPGSARASKSPSPDSRNWPGAVSLASLLLLLLPKPRRSPRPGLLLCFFVISLTLLGCGGGSKATPPSPGTTPGTYTFTVKAVDSANASITTSTTFTVQVQ